LFQELIVDALTKPLSTPRFLLLRDKLILIATQFACKEGGNNTTTSASTILDTASLYSIREQLLLGTEVHNRNLLSAQDSNHVTTLL
jgi:hypothetical protein